MSSRNLRSIAQAPGYAIDKNGHVYQSGKLVAPEVRNAPYGPRLTVQIFESWVPVHALISDVWYGGAVVLCRTGNPMLFQAESASAILLPLLGFNGRQRTFLA